MTLAEYLKDWREREHLTQQAAAKELDIPLTTLRGIEQGRPFRYERLLRLSVYCVRKAPANG
jgi:cytoskeletal protein RodZ